MILCEFFVAGDPVAQPRLRPRKIGKHLGVYMPQTARPWRQRVLVAGREAWGRAPLDCALEVDLHFVIGRPKSHRTGKGALTRSAPAFPTGKPDLDNLLKSTLDALNGTLWVDDSQVIAGHVSKGYVDEAEAEPGVSVTVRAAL